MSGAWSMMKKTLALALLMLHTACAWTSATNE